MTVIASILIWFVLAILPSTAFADGIALSPIILFKTANSTIASSSNCSNVMNPIATQSDIDGIAGCTTIDGELQIWLFGHDSNSAVVPPVNFTLPAGLQTVTGVFQILVFGNAQTTSLTAPGLVTIGLDLQITNSNTSLMTLSFPQLKSIGGQFDYNILNDNIASVAGFPALETIIGALDIDGGNFTTVDLPSLNYIGQGVFISSSNPDFQCPENIAKVGSESESENPGITVVIEGPNGSVCANQPGGSSVQPSSAASSTGTGPSSTGPSSTGSGTSASATTHHSAAAMNKYPCIILMSQTNLQVTFASAVMVIAFGVAFCLW